MKVFSSTYDERMDLMDTCYYAGKPGLRHWNGELELLELEHKRRIPFCWTLEL
jgi:hypothetical protein